MNAIEQWLPVLQWESRYSVSSFGRIRDIDNGKIVSTYAHSLGYRVVRLKRGDESVPIYVHRIIATAFHGQRPKGKQINHINGDKTYNWAENLEYLTPSENTQHAYDLGLTKCARGEKHGMAKLTEVDVREIRRIGHTMSKAQLARQFGVSTSSIQFIRQRVNWKHI